MHNPIMNQISWPRIEAFIKWLTARGKLPLIGSIICARCQRGGVSRILLFPGRIDFPPTLTLAPTTLRPRVDLRIARYWLKYATKAGPFLILPLLYHRDLRVAENRYAQAFFI